MKIKDLRISIKRSQPHSDPIADALQVLPAPGKVFLELIVENGIVGKSETYFGRVPKGPETLAALIENELKPLVLETEIEYVRQTHQAMFYETGYHGSSGLATYGISAVDTAIWDAWGKTLQVPCWKLWGGATSKLPVYAMIGWINYDKPKLQEKCMTALEQGFQAVKMKIGKPTMREDLDRLDFVRKIVGDEIDIMVDANQVFTVKEAMKRGLEFQKRGVAWFEEPLPADDLEGYLELKKSLPIPIAAGENIYSLYDFARFFSNQALDLVQPELNRAGGPSALLEIGHLAHAFRIPYASHGSNIAHVNVLASLPNSKYIEMGTLPKGSKLKIQDGCLGLPQGPGFSWD